MFITRKRKLSFSPLLLYINGSPIEKVSSFKYLGILISDDLSWSKHIEYICAKARRLLGFFYRSFSPSIDSQTFLSLYKAQVLPILEYGCAVWDPHLTKNIEKLENVQKFAFRIAYKLWSSKFTPYSSFNMPSLANRRIYLKLLLTYKLLHGFFYCPSGLFLFRANPNLRTSHNKQLIVTFSRTNSTFHSFFYSSVRLWNALHVDVVNSPTISYYKNSLKLMYL